VDAKLSKAEVREVYRKFASTYDLWSSLAESKARVRSLELADIRNGDAVLEVAVGTGMLFEKILGLNPAGRNEGIDLSEEMLARARVRAEKTGARNYVLKIGDAYHLENPENSFDVVLNNYMFDLIPERDFVAILNEFKRVLRQGGRLVLVNMTKGQSWFNAIWDRLYSIQPSLLGGCRGVELASYLGKAGFDKIRREYISQFVFPSEVIYAVKP
jgi:demethylmenaquinone methyltransferase / 2-methoxy-6-polyprenyl-1,4-benzoquinol methylase